MKKGTILFRGDIRDKGEIFNNSADYIFDGVAKNQANLNWFSDTIEMAEEYTSADCNSNRGNVECRVITEVELTKDLNLLDLTDMSLEEQFKFHLSLYNYGIKGNQYKEEMMSEYNGDYSKKSLKKFFGYQIDNMLNNGQAYTDGEKGIQFKQWLMDNNYDGYMFKTYKFGKDIAIIDPSNFKINKRTFL